MEALVNQIAVGRGSFELRCFSSPFAQSFPKAPSVFKQIR